MNLRGRIFWSHTGTIFAVFAGTASLFLLVLVQSSSGTAGDMLLAAGATALVGVITALSAAALISRRFEQALTGFETVLRGSVPGNSELDLPAESRREFEELAGAWDQMSEHAQLHAHQMENDRDRLRMVLNSMVEGVIAVDASQRIILVNEAACGMFKLREPSALGRPLWELIRNPRMQQWVAQSLAHTEPVGGEVEVLDPVARIFDVNVTRFPVHPQLGAVIVVGDVTELRRLERVRQEFVANASHELKTPLASIKACVETLLDGASADPRFLEKFLQSIDEQTDRLDALVRDMLTLARIESDAMAREPRPVRIVRTVEHVLNRHRQAAERKHLTINIHDNPQDLTVLVDEEALEQILDNLIDNAIKYTNPGGRVSLRWRADETLGVIDVEDTGIGIPQNQLPRIFERFYRVDRHRSRDIGGTGLGLSIVKHMVQAVGGSVTVSSRLHQGSVFTVRLPLYSARQSRS